MQTLRRTKTVKYTVNIPENMGEPQEVNYSLTNTLLVLFKLLEQKGLKFSPQMGAKITPKILEKLLLGEKLNDDENFYFSKNRAMNSFLMEIEETGGIDKETADCIRLSSKEFRENFEFKHDQI